MQGISPLMIAAEAGHESVVEYLVARNADVNRRDLVWYCI
jgi:ankyrin repeat protein